MPFRNVRFFIVFIEVFEPTTVKPEASSTDEGGGPHFAMSWSFPRRVYDFGGIHALAAGKRTSTLRVRRGFVQKTPLA